MDTYITTIQHVEMTDKEKEDLSLIMYNANKIGTKYLDEIKKNNKFSMDKFISLISVADENQDLDINGVIIPKTDLKIIKSVSKIENKVLSSVGALLTQLSYRASQNSQGKQLSFEDYYNEALMTARRAVYSYCQVDIKFTTFVQSSIINRFRNINNANKPLSRVSKKVRNIQQTFAKLKKQSPEMSFDDIVKQMNLSEKEIKLLKAATRTVTSMSQFEDNETQSFIETIPCSNNDQLFNGIDMNKILTFIKNEVSDWDYKVFVAFINGSHGWASKIAEENINPETGKKYSRRAPKVALDRVLEKIKVKFFNSYYSEAA